MIEMTLSSRHRIRNSSPGGLRPSTLPLGHGGSPLRWECHYGKRKLDLLKKTMIFYKNDRRMYTTKARFLNQHSISSLYIINIYFFAEKSKKSYTAVLNSVATITDYRDWLRLKS